MKSIPKLERRPYGPDSSPEEITAIKNRIQLMEPDLIFYKEVPVMSAFQVSQFEERLHELTQELPAYRVLVDLSESSPPSAELRKLLQQMFAGLPKIRRLSVYTEKNFIITVAARFVVRGFAGNMEKAVYRTREQAMQALRGD